MFNTPNRTLETGFSVARSWDFSNGLTITATQVKDGNGLWDVSAEYNFDRFNLEGGKTPEEVGKELEDATMDAVLFAEGLYPRCYGIPNPQAEVNPYWGIYSNPDELEEMPDGIDELAKIVHLPF